MKYKQINIFIVFINKQSTVTQLLGYCTDSKTMQYNLEAILNLPHYD